MKALILNSGMGARMGDVVPKCPKCMTTVMSGQTVLSRQLDVLEENQIKEVIITTGYLNSELENYCKSLNVSLKYEFVYNPDYSKTNYIYSIYLARNMLDDDIILLHGDLIFDNNILTSMLGQNFSCMAVNYANPLPRKDFKAVISENRIQKIGIEFFENSVSAWPLYCLQKNDWIIWLNKIIEFCEAGNTSCYAEKAFNEISNICQLFPYNLNNQLCGEIDTKEDLDNIMQKLKN